MTYTARIILYGVACWCSVLSACSNQSEGNGAVQEAAPPIGRYLTELRRDVQHEGTQYNRTVACYVDLTRPDNSYRFFVLDLARGTVLLQALCLNGLNVPIPFADPAGIMPIGVSVFSIHSATSFSVPSPPTAITLSAFD